MGKPKSKVAKKMRGNVTSLQKAREARWNNAKDSTSETPQSHGADPTTDVPSSSSTTPQPIGQESLHSEVRSCPELSTEENVKIEGRRIVDIMSFIQEVQQLCNHAPFSCTFSDMFIMKFTDMGLNFSVWFKCRSCGQVDRLDSNNDSSSSVTLNTWAVSGAIAAGIGHKQLTTVLGGMNIPCFSDKTFIKEQDVVYRGWEASAQQLMMEAAEEEKAAAIERGSYVLLWRRGASVLTADKIMVTRDTRFRLVDGFNLEISNVVPQDAGDYVCQIGDGDNRDQIHTVEILVPPSIRTSPAGGQLTARKGGTITLECKASGNPVPTISWSRKDHSMSTSDKAGEGFSITLEKVDRHQAGVYQCTASNGVGDPVTVDMTLDVLYPPEIEVERSWVHSGEGYEAQLVCIVHGEPAPNVVWYQDSFIMEPTERKTMETRGNKHALNIKHVQASDFGNYSCVAENSLGRAKKYMELSGRPSPAQFRSTPFSRNKDSYNLTWMVESYPPLEEVRLLYRKIMMNDTHQKHGKWHEVILHPNNGDTFTHLMSYNIRNLEAASVFEAIAQAKNRYGWNEVSDLYQFYTRGPDYPSEPSLEDMELVAATSSQSTKLLSIEIMTFAVVMALL